ncbi:MAG: hypothetical protein ABW138_02695, partial [Candidatus Thiodiazotropha sp. 4PDIVS1]
KIASALRVTPEKAPFGVARRSFGVTKPLPSRLDWRFSGATGSIHLVLTGPKAVCSFQNVSFQRA